MPEGRRYSYVHDARSVTSIMRSPPALAGKVTRTSTLPIAKVHRGDLGYLAPR
jgi:hypothetical protein